jgi:pSer/pThr/pTyr-binding forkhead associated (FHA) protein
MPEPQDLEAVGDDTDHGPDRTEAFDPVEETRHLRAREAAAGIPGLDGYALVITGGPGEGGYWTLEEGINEVGRNLDAAVFLDDITVSRHHAEFRVAGGSLTLRDLRSTNGTYVNRQRVDVAALEAGDEVIIGRFHLVVARGA